MHAFIVTAKDRLVVAWLCLVLGALLTVLGVLGVWIQEPLELPTPLTFGEVFLLFTFAAAFLACGTMIVTGLILSSRITAAWTVWRRFLALVCFGACVLAACVACGYLASQRIADRIQ